jgi:hypothetical protein
MMDWRKSKRFIGPGVNHKRGIGLRLIPLTSHIPTQENEMPWVSPTTEEIKKSIADHHAKLLECKDDQEEYLLYSKLSQLYSDLSTKLQEIYEVNNDWKGE